ETLTTEGVWDDTDIVHVVFDKIQVPNFHTFGGLRLESSATESLVVKLGGNSRVAGFDATGTHSIIDDRIGGSLQVIGQPGRPVILTSIADKTDGAGMKLDGSFQSDTLRDGFGNVAGRPAGRFDISLNYSAEVEANPVLVAGLEEAAKYWEQRLTDNVSVAFDVVLAETGSEPFASAGADGFSATYDDIIARMQADASENERSLLDRLPTFAQLRVQGPAGPFTVSNIISMGLPNAKALGFVQGVDFQANPSQTKVGATRDGQINVTSLYRLGATVESFASVFIHEMAHALGFSSSVPEDGNFGGGITLTTLDLFRMAPGGGAGDFTNNPRVVDPAREQVFYDGGLFDPAGIDIPGLTKGDIPLSRGVEPHPDRGQPSHWRSSAAVGMNGITLGIMDPSAGSFVTSNDERALGLIGYDFADFRLPVASSPGDWRGIQLDEFSHDRNVDVLTELESSSSSAAGANSIPDRAEFLGGLADAEFHGDENLRFGFKVPGVLNTTDDVDVYSFEGIAGTDVWLDIDQTTSHVDTVLELIDANGEVLARSNNSLANDQFSPSGTAVTGTLGLDHYSVNPKDAGMRVTLPGTAGSRGTYFVRVRSHSPDLANLQAGQTEGAYELHVRLRELDEIPGTVIKFADLRFAKNGVEALGLITHSPLQTERVEPGDIASFETALNLGEVYSTDRAEVSISGNLEPIQFDDDGEVIAGVDWYRFSLASVVPGISIDVDYADGAGGPNTNVSVWRVGVSEGDDEGEEDDDYAVYDLVYFGDTSNVTLDRSTMLSGGSFGIEDPFIGPIYPNFAVDGSDTTEVLLPDRDGGDDRAVSYAGEYLLAIASERLRPDTLIDQFLRPNAINPDANVAPTELIIQNAIDFSDREVVDIPFSLNDMTLFVTTMGAASALTSVNPFTGTALQGGPRALQDDADTFRVGSLAMRGDGRLYSLSLGADDAASGNFLEVDWAQAIDADFNALPENTTNLRDDEIKTFGLDPADPTMVTDWDDGIQFQGLTFTSSLAYAVGNRGGAADPMLEGPEYLFNIVYSLDAYPREVDGNQIDPGTAVPTDPVREMDLMGMPPMEGAFTDIIEVGVFTVPPGELIQGISELDGDLYGISNLGRLYKLVLGAPGTPGTTSLVRNIQAGANFT
ncbi:MAG TPA: NF038122 family metalloprotease, partial [Pirellulaceae bacterium]